MNAFYEQYRHGSGGWHVPDPRDPRLFAGEGPAVGFACGKIMRIKGDAPLITIGGAGSGKLRDVIAYNVCGVRGTKGQWIAPRRMFVNDPRGELAAISIQNQVRLGKAAYCINSFGLHNQPQHKVNPWALLDARLPTFHTDVSTVIADLMPRSGSSNAEYFELRGRDACSALVKMLVHQNGSVTMPDLYEIVNSIENADLWTHIHRAMLETPFPDVQRMAHELDAKRENAPKEYGAILGEIHKCLSFLADPSVRETLSGSDFSLDVLCKEDCNVYLMTPAEYGEILAPMTRAIIGAVMIHKQRKPSAPGILLLIDEASQLGPRFESLLRGYSYGRGMGLRMWTYWQDTGQIVRNLGREALGGFLGSSQVRQFFSARDYETASMISKMLGMQTLEYDSELEQAAARRNQAHIIRELLDGADPLEAGLNYAQQERASINRMKQARAVLTPDEVLNMPEDKQILFISGLGVMPLWESKYPYYTRAEMAGGYTGNPYHPPIDKVRVQTFFGPRWRNVITERVPARYAHLPQYHQSGEWSYIEGYRPS